ncbi:MAG: MgtC/SapB family protein [Candidatus Bipolaricaulota bacterium]|nr:MgtC/SapB family protein [Candidatus Bipolaricaulota bacterium]MCS7274174.1 MgtC/SapB family protein [Candidatus Bipolaricaulota bacterium]MDW8110080.1 MgtC/SapB family protein [Candidatus Bipolaricaulota bacterium]
MQVNGELLVRLVVAALLGAVVGWERERAQRPAGLRTYMLVAFGSALFTVLSSTAFAGAGADPSRIAANIVVGIGFLGAGTIFRAGEAVRGLTTAAGLWAIAAIGMAAGAGEYLLALFSTVLVLGILWGVRFVETHKNSQEND